MNSKDIIVSIGLILFQFVLIIISIISVLEIVMDITQKEIAEKAGVSRASVSRLVTGSAPVNKRTAKKIRLAAEELGAKEILPADIAPNFILKKNIMIIVGDVSNEFYSQIVKGCCNTLEQNGCYAIVCNSGYDVKKEKEFIRNAVSDGMGGIILITAIQDNELGKMLENISIPIVLTNRYIRSAGTNMVCIDNYNGGYSATQHLIYNGHKRILFLGGFNHSTAVQDRYRGYADAVSDSSAGIDRRLVRFSDQTIEDGQKIIEDVLSESLQFTAVFSCGCQLALGAVKALKTNGFSIPKDMSFICFDDSPLIGEFGLNLSTVCCDPVLLGEESVNMLLKNIHGKTKDNSILLLSPGFIDRGSVRRIKSLI